MRDEQMSDDHLANHADPDPDSPRFKPAPIEGMPYKRGSEEDLAIRRVIAEADARAADRAPT
jgi:hypothetical protein